MQVDAEDKRILLDFVLDFLEWIDEEYGAELCAPNEYGAMRVLSEFGSEEKYVEEFLDRDQAQVGQC